jgi:hypothetical protein
MPTSKVFRDAQIDQDLARELYAVESDPNYKPFAQDVGQALQTIKNSGVRIVPAASGHRPNLGSRHSHLPTVRLPPNRRKRPRSKPSRRAAATKGAETPACQGPGPAPMRLR